MRKEHRIASLSGLLMARARSRPTQTGQLVAAGVARVCVVCVLSNYGQRHIELLSSKMRTEANRRRHLHRGMQGQQTPKHKTPGRKTTRGSSGRTVSDEILELQTTSRHLISPAQNFRNELSETAMQYFFPMSREIAGIPHRKTC